jgi:hypothetical protein
MKAIRPVHLHESGAEVSNLHKGLLFLIRHQPGISDNDRKTIKQRLEPELLAEKFGDATAEIVGIWQNLLKSWPDLPPDLKAKVAYLPVSDNTRRGNGDVDELTAEGLTWILVQYGGVPRSEDI